MFISLDPSLSGDKWEEYTLLIPCVSVGNVGQLASDLIISTLWMYRVGAIDTSAIVPVVGNNPYAATSSQSSASSTFELCTALEVFENQDRRLVSLQQRAPCVPGRGALLVRQLLEFVTRFRFRQILVLTSSIASERRDDSISGRQQRYFGGDGFDAASIRRLEEFGVASLPPDTFLAGCGLAKSLAAGFKASGVPCVVLLAFVSEGDNARDALQLADSANALLELADLTGVDMSGRNRTWRVPDSWKLMYGARADQILFQ